MIAADVMTRELKWLPPSASVSDAIHLMRDESVRHLPVIDGGHLVGMLSEQDIRDLALAAVLAADRETRELRLSQTIGPLVTRDVIQVAPEAELRSVVDLLVDKRVGAVLVVEPDGGRVAGVVSVVDALRAVRDLV